MNEIECAECATSVETEGGVNRWVAHAFAADAPMSQIGYCARPVSKGADKVNTRVFARMSGLSPCFPLSFRDV